MGEVREGVTWTENSRKAGRKRDRMRNGVTRNVLAKSILEKKEEEKDER